MSEDELWEMYRKSVAYLWGFLAVMGDFFDDAEDPVMASLFPGFCQLMLDHDASQELERLI